MRYCSDPFGSIVTQSAAVAVEQCRICARTASCCYRKFQSGTETGVGFHHQAHALPASSLVDPAKAMGIHVNALFEMPELLRVNGLDDRPRGLIASAGLIEANPKVASVESPARISTPVIRHPLALEGRLGLKYWPHQLLDAISTLAGSIGMPSTFFNS